MNRSGAGGGADDGASVGAAAANRERTRSRVTLATPDRLPVAAARHYNAVAAPAEDDEDDYDEMGGKKVIPRSERTMGAPTQANARHYRYFFVLNNIVSKSFF